MIRTTSSEGESAAEEGRGEYVVEGVGGEVCATLSSARSALIDCARCAECSL